MKTLHFEILINAPRERVWNTMLGDATYRDWSSAFNPGSYYEGGWEKGDSIRFLSPEGDGMLSEIAESRFAEFVSIRHLGFIYKGVEDTESPEVKAWLPAYENYTFEEAEDGALVKVDLDSEEKYSEMFEAMWPNALERLKEITEEA